MIERLGVRCARAEEACAAAVTLWLCSEPGWERAGAGADSQRRAGFYPAVGKIQMIKKKRLKDST
jgi:hypothetical protein